jgi:hypothetical protein
MDWIRHAWDWITEPTNGVATFGAVTGATSLFFQAKEHSRKVKGEFWIEYENPSRAPVLRGRMLNKGTAVTAKHVEFINEDRIQVFEERLGINRLPQRLEKYEEYSISMSALGKYCADLGPLRRLRIYTVCGMKVKAPRRLLRRWNQEAEPWAESVRERAKKDAAEAAAILAQAQAEERARKEAAEVEAQSERDKLMAEIARKSNPKFIEAKKVVFDSLGTGDVCMMLRNCGAWQVSLPRGGEYGGPQKNEEGYLFHDALVTLIEEGLLEKQDQSDYVYELTAFGRQRKCEQQSSGICIGAVEPKDQLWKPTNVVPPTIG